MKTGRKSPRTPHERMTRGALAPLRWTLLLSSGVLAVAGTLAQALALLAIAGAEGLGAPGDRGGTMNGHRHNASYAAGAA